MLLRPFLYEETACASYLFGCLSRSSLAVSSAIRKKSSVYRW